MRFHHVDISICYSRGVLDLAILGLLGESDRHGYEIRRLLRDELGIVANVSFGSIYPALARLERAGAIEVVAMPAPSSSTMSAASTGSLAGERAAARGRRAALPRGLRSRKVYRLTPAGKELFARLLAAAAPADDSRSFGLRLALAGHLVPTARLELLGRRRAELVRRLGELEATAAGTRLDPYARAVVEHGAQGVRHDIEWLDDLIAAERGDDDLGAVALTSELAP